VSSLRRGGAGEAEVSNLELFYDLVFVFAITQVSHLLLDHLTWTGAGHALLVLLVVWWSWNFTTWATNELDPESRWVRVLMIGLMLLGLIMAVAIPEAFGDQALLFAGAYVAIQLTRQSFLTFVAGQPGSLERRRASHILAWFALAAVFWLAGAVDEQLRPPLWLIALGIDYAGPLFSFRLPGRRISAEAWQVEPSHLSERFQLFVIIALGESIVVTGATTSALPLDASRLLALAIAFLMTAALWWLYFRAVAQRVRSLLVGSEGNRTLVARDVYTYLHVVLVAGIVVAAVGDELVIAHPGHELATAELVALIAGPVLYLVAQGLTRLRARGDVSATRSAGVAGCLLVGAIGLHVSALATAGLLLLVLVAVIASEERRAADRGRPAV